MIQSIVSCYRINHLSTGRSFSESTAKSWRPICLSRKPSRQPSILKNRDQSIRTRYISPVCRATLGLPVKTPTMTSKEIEELVLKLHEIEAVKFGDFKLKSGIMSPVYIDLRIIVSYPEVLAKVAEKMWQEVQGAKFDLLCGVPYTALPIASAMMLAHGTPMVMRRKEVKDYGTKKAIEGAFQAGQTCLIVEDLVTSGLSVFETVQPLKDVGLLVTDVVVLIDREQGGEKNLNAGGLTLHSAFKLTEILSVLQKHSLVTDEVAESTRKFLADNQVSSAPAATPAAAAIPARKRLSFEERLQFAQNPTGKKIFEIMIRKKSNLSVAADVDTAEEMLALADKIGPEICIFKTHVDMFDTWDSKIAQQLQELAVKHDFLIFEDRKFADIGNTVLHQYKGGVYKIADWSTITNAHLVPGPGIIDGLKTVGLPKGNGLLLLAEMSTKGALATGSYTEAVVKAAEENLDFVIGFISIRPKLWGPISPGLLHMTPGVKLAAGGDALGQQYLTPETVMGPNGSDVIIVGRGIIAAADPQKAAAEYRAAGWNAYLADLA